eukprot:553470-Alexandrium_andersonii.AAC.1
MLIPSATTIFVAPWGGAAIPWADPQGQSLRANSPQAAYYCLRLLETARGSVQPCLPGSCGV